MLGNRAFAHPRPVLYRFSKFAMDDNKKATPEEAEDAVMQQSYPSPMADSAEARYYEQLRASWYAGALGAA